MSLTIGQTLHGFTVDNIREVPEQHGKLVEMTHAKTSASLVWMDNGELNKLFCVGFKTLPEDSTGVFHILEHSVLCGSDKYPVREPFVELIKSSMNTFLNAMTFSDKTIYPVSSRNEQDFMNLTEVYLDATFAPAILKNPNIFYQEGWHIELGQKADLGAAEDGTPSYKGVVFNEMKGAMSDVNELIYQRMLAMLFPDNCYGFNSGGDPTVIPQLTYEQFLSMYNRYYHPSNARIWLDGAVPLDRVLPLIDSYLAKHERSDEKHVIALQAPHAVECTQNYALSAEEDATNRGYFSLGSIVANWSEKRRIMAINILMDVLMGNNEAPLKKALLDAGLCQDVSFMVDDSIAQPWLTLSCANIKDGSAEELRAIIRKTCAELAENGIDKAALTASINVAEFHHKAPHEPAALMRCINALNTWLHDGDPITYLQSSEDFAELRAMVENGGFDALLKELDLGGEGSSVLHTLPSKTYEAEMKADEDARLAATVNAWNEDDKAANKALNEGLSAWQQTPDTAEQLATLPVLNLRDIPEKCEFIKTCEQTVDGATVLTHAIPGSGVTRMSLSFKLTDCTLEEISKIAVMTKLLGSLPTENYTASELTLAQKTWLGELSFSVDACGKGTDACVPVLVVNCAVLDQNLGKAKELILEILTKTDFSDKTRIGNILLQQQEMVRQMNIGRGNVLAIREAAASLTAANAATEAAEGISFQRTLKALCESLDEGFIALVKRVQAETVCRSRLVLSIVSDKAEDAIAILNELPLGAAVAETAGYASSIPAKSAVVIPAQIGYAVLAADFKALKMGYTGAAQVISNILTYSYLWNEVRVQGGAYGCGMRIGRSGVMTAHSYRDPTPARSLNVYRKLAQALRDFVAGDEKLDKYIISTVAETEPPLGAAMQKRMADNAWWAGLTAADQQQERSEILRTDDAALLAWCPVLEAMAETGNACVVAHDGAVKACEAEHLENL